MRDPAKRALAVNPADPEAKLRLKAARVTLLVAYVAAGRGHSRLGPARRRLEGRARLPPRGVAAWPDALDPFYRDGPLAGATALFGAAIQGSAKLAEHVRGVIEAGIREDARLNQDRDRHVGGPVDVVLVDAGGRAVRGAVRPAGPEVIARRQPPEARTGGAGRAPGRDGRSRGRRRVLPKPSPSSSCGRGSTRTRSPHCSPSRRRRSLARRPPPSGTAPFMRREPSRAAR